MLRRPNATAASLSLGLRGLTATAQYNVSWTGTEGSGVGGFQIARSATLAGSALSALSVSLSPSTSVVVRYAKLA